MPNENMVGIDRDKSTAYVRQMDVVQYWLVGSDGKKLQLPINPPANEFTSPFSYEDVVVEGLGEVSIINRRNMRTFEITSIYPVEYNAAFCACEPTLSPREFYNQLENWRNARAPIRYIITGANGFSIAVTIRDIKASFDMFGNPNDLYYTLSLKEYQPPKVTVKNTATNASTSTNKTSSTSNKTTSSTNRPASTTNKTATSTTTHTVKKNESLWKIAKKYYGDGNQWRKIYDANKKTIGSNPNKISVGMKLVIPK